MRRWRSWLVLALIASVVGIGCHKSSTVGLTIAPTTATVLINNTTAAVKATLPTSDTTSITLDLPAGPFLRVEIGHDAPINLDIAGQTFTGSFSFEQVVVTPTTKILRIA